jgi:hypothetical protein
MLDVTTMHFAESLGTVVIQQPLILQQPNVK